MPITPGNPNVILQGVDCWIEADNIRDVRTGVLIDVTTFTVHAVARAAYERMVLGRPLYLTWRYKMMMPIVAEWDTTPTGTWGTITAGGADTPNLVSIHVTPADTVSWRCPLVIVQAEMTDPITGYKSRIVNQMYEIDFEANRPPGN
jgi:hypothetical protein